MTHSLSLVTSFSTAEEFPTENFMKTGTFPEGKKNQLHFVTVKWNKTRNLINSSCLNVLHKKTKISFKSHHVLRGFKFVHLINGKEKIFSSENMAWEFFPKFLCPKILNVNSHRTLKTLLNTHNLPRVFLGRVHLCISKEGRGTL